jgi:hypothetical protein
VVGYQAPGTSDEYKQAQKRLKDLETAKNKLYAEQRKTKAKLSKASSTAASAPTGGSREAQIRAAAKAKGLDPDVAVQRAKNKGIL